MKKNNSIRMPQTKRGVICDSWKRSTKAGGKKKQEKKKKHDAVNIPLERWEGTCNVSRNSINAGVEEIEEIEKKREKKVEEESKLEREE